MFAATGMNAAVQRMVELKFAQSDLLSLQNFQSDHAIQQQLQQLRDSTGVDDPELLQRLLHAGLNARNICALNWLPIALVAWASQGVSKEEAQAAKLVKLHAIFTSNNVATQLFQSWLDERPSENLVRLWEEFIDHQAQSLGADQLSQTGQAIWYVAQRVAKSSGGLLGIGQISGAEQRILQRIRAAYGLQDHQLPD